MKISPIKRRLDILPELNNDNSDIATEMGIFGHK